MITNEEELKDGNDGDEVSQESPNVQKLFPGFDTFDDYMKAGFNVMKEGIKITNSLPSEDNFKYYSCFPSFNSARNYQSERILKLIQGIVSLTGASTDVNRRSIDEKLDLLVEANDIFLDRANVLMNEECGIKPKAEVQLIVAQAKKSTNINGSWNTVNRDASTTSGISNTQSVRLLGAKNVQRPQLTFKDKVDNSSKPWMPRIKEKPNALKPLSLISKKGTDEQGIGHPYEFELDTFQVPSNQLKENTPVKYKSLDETPMLMIEKETDMEILLNDLQNYNEIAIDLEHHSYRSFQGITCLMQISTRDTDYLIDTLSLRSELYRLNEVFTKPTVLKVFHGADFDIQWLQRDLSLYVVNMFDTHQAAKQLELPYLSLAYLLKTYCGIEPNKHFQLADWRIRPLPQELTKYAREDTHYLLYIKDVLRNALIQVANGKTNVLKAIYNRSTQVCKKVYIKPIWTEETCLNMYRKSQKMFNNRQLYALKELHKWRDVTAREEDDSVNYVLPNHMLLNIAETLPREMQGILACCNPIPPLVRQNLLRLHKIILKSREQPLIKPILEDDIRQRMTQRSHVAQSETWIYSPHDTPQGTEPRANLTCLLNSKCTQETFISKKTDDHDITVFDNSSDDEEIDLSKQTICGNKKLPFVSPFERYKRVMPMIAEQEAKEREKQEIEKKNILTNKEKNESIQRVQEHFNDIVQNKYSSNNIALSQMHNRKRKIHTINEKKEENETYDLSAQAEVFKNKLVNENMKVCKEETTTDKFNVQSNKRAAEDETLQSLRPKKKGVKQETVKLLNAKGMLPAKSFNYNAVDFSSFQGGSNIGKQEYTETVFKQNKEKHKRTGQRKRRKI